MCKYARSSVNRKFVSTYVVINISFNDKKIKGQGIFGGFICGIQQY